MSSQTTTPIWRTALTLKVMFWTGVAFAPLAAIVLLLGDSGGTIKFALILGLGSVVLIGLSVTWRRDASSVERDLVIAMSDVEADNHRLIAELRAEVRQLNRNGEPPRAVGGRDPREDRGRRPARPGADAGPAPMDDGRQQRRTGGHPKPRRANVDYDELESTGPLEAQDRPEPPTRGDGYAPPRYDDRRDDRRREPSRSSTRDESELVRHTETVSVTRRETTTMRAEQESRYRAGGQDSEAGVYRGGGAKTSFGDKLGKLRKSKGSQDDGAGRFNASAEADSLLSGLQDDNRSTTDWYGGQPVDETRVVPRQRGRHDEPATGSHAEYDRPPRDRAEPRSGAWRTEERSAELRMGRREARSGPENGWQDDTGGRASNWSGEPADRRGRHYDGPEPTRAIASYEEDPQPRWTDFESGRLPNTEAPAKGGSYMDEYYGDGRR